MITAKPSENNANDKRKCVVCGAPATAFHGLPEDQTPAICRKCAYCPTCDKPITVWQLSEPPGPKCESCDKVHSNSREYEDQMTQRHVQRAYKVLATAAEGHPELASELARLQMFSAFPEGHPLHVLSLADFAALYAEGGREAVWRIAASRLAEKPKPQKKKKGPKAA